MKKNSHVSVWGSYRTELTITTLLLGGVALMVTDQPIHLLVHKFIQLLRDSYTTLKGVAVSIFIEPFVHLEVSDIIGVMLITIALGKTLVHIRRKMITNSYEARTCPICHSKLHRIHRNKWQLWLSRAFYLSSGYYHCSACDHSSLRFFQKTPHLHQG